MENVTNVMENNKLFRISAKRILLTYSQVDPEVAQNSVYEQ